MFKAKKAGDEAKTAEPDNPHLFVCRRSFHDGTRMLEVGELIDLSAADPRRVRAMRSTGMLYSPEEWAQAKRADQASGIRRRAAEEAAAIGADCQSRAEAAAERIEAEGMARVHNEAGAARQKILGEREGRLAELREKTDALLAELAPDRPLSPGRR